LFTIPVYRRPSAALEVARDPVAMGSLNLEEIQVHLKLVNINAHTDA
jgi:hypothetical protein